jgi:DNA polymerase
VGCVTNQALLDDLCQRVRGCTLCSLARTRTKSVPGEGPIDAEIMFIGEAPGANEDKQGRPFVGAAGQFLEELLAAASLTRDEVYICNVLKCRPPGNRDPQPDEIEACRDYLDEQIDLIDPLVIVTLGRFSMAKFFPNQAISRIHGQPRFAAGRCYVPMYHPAAALHQQNLRNVILDDFRMLPSTLARVRASRAPAPVVLHPAAAAVQPSLLSPAAPAPATQVALSAAPTPTQQQGRLFD